MQTKLNPEKEKNLDGLLKKRWKTQDSIKLLIVYLINLSKKKGVLTILSPESKIM